MARCTRSGSASTTVAGSHSQMKRKPPPESTRALPPRQLLMAVLVELPSTSARASSTAARFVTLETPIRISPRQRSRYGSASTCSAANSTNPKSEAAMLLSSCATLSAKEDPLTFGGSSGSERFTMTLFNVLRQRAPGGSHFGCLHRQSNRLDSELSDQQVGRSGFRETGIRTGGLNPLDIL